jgi:hypothetical protein
MGAMRRGDYAGLWHGPTALLGGAWWVLVAVLLAGGVGCLVLARAQLRAAAADRGRRHCRQCGASVAPGAAMCPRCRSLDVGLGRARDVVQPGLLLWGAAVLVTLGGLAAALGVGSLPVGLALAGASPLAGVAIAAFGGRVRLSGATG